MNKRPMTTTSVASYRKQNSCYATHGPKTKFLTASSSSRIYISVFQRNQLCFIASILVSKELLTFLLGISLDKQPFLCFLRILKDAIANNSSKIILGQVYFVFLYQKGLLIKKNSQGIYFAISTITFCSTTSKRLICIPIGI